MSKVLNSIKQNKISSNDIKNLKEISSNDMKDIKDILSEEFEIPLENKIY